MRVKKLEIFGFKSFANRQTISFGQGVTGIVGPNGCGKSNVVDALRWVMGEQNARHLRGGNMQDIIFCGSEKKAPLGFAEVILTIENNEQDAPLEYNHYNEIEIARRLYKSGESEYEINRQKARLKDISDFFLGTGVGTKAYSIIEQGRVNEIISAKPLDRRQIIEEAAGITKYKTKKVAAERRMEATRVNLHRIIDIKNEVDKRLASLSREKEKLLKVLNLKNQIRTLDLHVASHRYLALNAQFRFFNQSSSEITELLAHNDRDFFAAEHGFQKILENYTKKHENKRLLEEIEHQHKSTLELLKKDIEYIKNTLTDNHTFIARLETQIADNDNRESELKKDIVSFEEEHRDVSTQLAAATETLAAKKNAGNVVTEQRQKNLYDEQNAQKKIIEAATKAERIQGEINTLSAQESQKNIDIKNLHNEVQQKAEELSMMSSRLTMMQTELDHANQRKNTLTFTMEELEHRLSFLRETDTGHKNQLRALEEEKMQASSRLRSLAEIDSSLEWSESGLNEILASEHKHLIKGLIADVIQVKPGFEDAAEKCLAHILDAALVSDNQGLNHIAEFLRKKRSPKTAFFLLNRSPQTHNFTRPLGLKSLNDIVTIKNEFASLSAHFGRIFFADTLLNAFEHWPAAQLADATIVSLEGEMLFPDGRAIVLGDGVGEGVLKRKNEIKTLEKTLETVTDALLKQKKIAEESSRVMEFLVQEKEMHQEELKTLNLGIARSEESIKQKKFEMNKAETDSQKLEEKRGALSKSLADFDEQVQQKKALWALALEEHKHHEELLHTIRLERGLVETNYEAFLQELKQIEIEKVGFYEKAKNLSLTIEQAQKNLSHSMAQQQSLKEQIAEKEHEELRLKENERQAEKKLAALSHELEEIKRQLLGLIQECSLLHHEKTTAELHLGQFQTKGQELKSHLHKVELEINNARNDIKNLCERISDRYRVDLTRELTDYHLVPIDEVAAKKQSEDLQKSVDRMGSVNENAAHEFDELHNRAQFLESQINDLNDALGQLESAIKKINKTTKMRFLEAFNNINKQFSLVFPRLFNGGKAELVLCDQEDLLTSGIDIVARPPGKNLSSIELMSGGEKALTAISLIMAIFLIKPSPFCLLDEVDAPLDEANVSRFSQLIKEMSQLSQFILITHNRKTMESADQLYGVTMEDAGMSKIVSVHVQQAYETLKQPFSKKKPSQLQLEGL